MRVNGLPRPTRYVTHRRDGLTVAREDFEFVPFPVVVEVSGRRGTSPKRIGSVTPDAATSCRKLG
jgi:hypothetical protein